MIAGLPAEWRVLLPAEGALPPLGVRLPLRPEALLDEPDEAAFRASDERMPYFATLWPTTVGLAQAIRSGPRLDDRDVLDLGCGVGAAGLAAAQMGARASFLDWEPRALLFVERAAARLGLRPAGLHAADWRRPPAELGRFDRILASDVLYEARNVAAVADFLAGRLAPAGEAWIADPGRLHAAPFAAALEARGLRHEEHPLGTHRLHVVRPR